jgi:diguanylate cyclase (GGDEF)-like protein
MRFTIVAALFTLLFSPYFILYLKLPYTGLMNLFYGVSLALTPLLLQRTGSLRVAANWTLACALSVLVLQTWLLGGVSSLAYPWLSCIPVAAMLLRGVRGGAVWTAATVVAVAGVGVADAAGLMRGGPATSTLARGATTVTMTSLTIALGALAWLAESRADRFVEDLHRQKQTFRERSLRDWLTGLANRSLMTECLIQSWERARRHGPRCALFFIDLNDFKQINDEHGHAAGDRVLREIGARLRDAVRSSDLVGRIGGDEFALIVEGAESRSAVAALADKVSSVIEEPIRIDTVSARVGASIGIAFYPDRGCHFGDRITLPRVASEPIGGPGEVDEESVRQLLEKADAAMYTAKRKGLPYWIHEHELDDTRRRVTERVSEPPPAA